MTPREVKGQGTVIRAAVTLVVGLACLFSAATAQAAPYRDTIAGTSGLVGYWRLGDTSGSTALDELHIQNGVYRGAPALRQPGAIAGDPNTSAYFNAISQYVQIAHRPSYAVNGFTVETWIYLTGYGNTAAWRRIASRGAATSQRNWMLALAAGTQGRVNFSFSDGSAVQSATGVTSLALGRWYHLAFVHVPAQRMQLYVNGLLDGERATTARPVSGNSPIVIAGDGNDTGANARYDEFAVYNRALSAVEVRAHYTAGVDNTPPETTIGSGPSGPTRSVTPAFAFGSSESGSRFECRTDSGSWAACTSPKTTLALLDGSHTFQVRAIDGAGNVDPTPASRSFTVDTLAPDTTITGGPTGTTNVATPAFTLTSGDPGARFECQADGAAWSACSASWSPPALGEGAHTLAARAVDAAGNADASPATRLLTVDLSAPNTTLAGNPSGTTASKSATLTISSPDAGARFECQAGGGAWAACTSPYAITGLSDGAHSFAARAIDAAGNRDPSPATAAWTVDATPPDTTIAGPSGGASNASPSFSLASDDTGARFECQADGSGWSACTSPYAMTGLSDGAHSFAARAIDAAGNRDPSPATAAWTVLATPPQTRADSGPSGLTRDPTPSFSFSSGRPAATFTCRLDGGDWSSCSSPAGFGTLDDGPHTVEVRATDAGGDDPTPAAWTFTVDTSAPETSIDSASAGEVAFSSPDDDATFECRLDGGDWDPCTSPHTYSDLADGDHTAEVRARDAAGNADPTPAPTSWTTSLGRYRRAVESTSGLVSFWRLGEQGGTLAADSNGSNDGGYEGSVEMGASGAIDGDADTAVRFPGDGSDVSVPAAASLSPAAVSLEAWVDPAAGPQTVISKGGQYRLSVDGGTVSFEVDTTREADGRTAASYDPGALAPAGWRHVVATFDGYNANVFVDGLRVATQRVVGAEVADPANNPSVLTVTDNPLVLGGFDGKLDDVALYDRALTPLEIEHHYELGGGPGQLAGACWSGFGSFGAGSPPPGCWRPYADASPFNRRLPTDPTLDPKSADIVSTLMSWGDSGFEGKPSQLNSPRTPGNDWMHPTYYARPGDPVYTVDCTYDGRWGPCPIDGLRIRVPAGAKPAADGYQPSMDHHMAIVDQQTGWEYDLWGAWRPSGGTLTTKWGAMTPINGDGLESGATASKFSNLAGIIRAPELAAGKIDHALFMVVNCVNSDDEGPAEAVYPAFDDGQPCSWLGRDGTNAPRMGARFWLDISDAEIAAVPVPWQRTVLRAMRDYGMLVGDTGGGTYGWSVQLESDATYTSFGQPGQMEQFGRANKWIVNTDWVIGDMRMTRAFWADHLKVVDPCVSRGSCP